MKHVRAMERSLRITSGLVTLSALTGLFHPQTALAQSQYLTAAEAGDFICYMQTSDGRVMNLSRLCGGRQPNVSTTSTLDRQFLQRYQGFLQKRAKGSPAIQTLISQAQQDPQSVIRRAKAICTAMRTGQPQPTAGQLADDLFQTMAPKYYCPELDD